MSDNKVVRSDQRGMVSFLVTLIMMMVITLIVIGFSQVTRRNAREALDRQLSAQAFYSAESGINVTQAAITNYVIANGYVGLATKTTCTNEYNPTNPVGTTPIAQLSNGVGYTCVLVNPTPSSLQFPVNQQDSTVVPMGVNDILKKLTIKWSMQAGGSQTTCAGASDSTFTPSAIWGADCDFGVLRMDMISNPNTNATNATSLASNTDTLFLTPRGTHPGTATTVSFGGATTAYVVSGTNCSSGTCQAVITLPDDTANYAIRATTLYKDSSMVTITGVTDSGTAQFLGSQAVVDVTGQDQDELRRIQARVALTSTGSGIPANALAGSNGICKRFSILPTDNLDLTTAATCN
jgi:Tfp pilus assembly protein PilX